MLTSIYVLNAFNRISLKHIVMLSHVIICVNRLYNYVTIKRLTVNAKTNG